MSIQRYKQAKNVALSVAIMLATTSMLAGCRSEITAEPVPITKVVDNTSDISSSSESEDEVPLEGEVPSEGEVTLEDLYVDSNGSYIGYREYAEENDIDANTKFFTYDWKTTKYNAWSPQLEDWNYLMDLDDEDGSDVYVEESSGSFVPYFMWWGLMSSSQRSNVAYNKVNFVTQTADGNYAEYKPSTAELNQIKEGKFVGKTANRPAVKRTNLSGDGKVSTLTKSSSGITKKSTPGTTTTKSTTGNTSSTSTKSGTTGTTSTSTGTTGKSTGTTSTSTGTTSTSTGTTGKSTSVTTPSTSSSGNTSSFGGSTTRSGGGSSSGGSSSGGGSTSTGG